MNCYQVTDQGLENLKGANTINLWNCDQITGKGLGNLKGAKIIRKN